MRVVHLIEGAIRVVIFAAPPGIENVRIPNARSCQLARDAIESSRLGESDSRMFDQMFVAQAEELDRTIRNLTEMRDS